MAKRKKKRSGVSRLALVAVAVLAVFSIRGRIMLMTGTGVEEAPPVETVTPAPETTPQPTPEPTPAVPQPNDFTLLVNLANPLNGDYRVQTREIICNGAATGKQFDVRVIDKLEKMLSDAAAAGYPMLVRSAHRSISYQQMLYSNKVNAYLNAGYNQAAAEAEAGKWVAPPGTSEHNLGIVVDVVNQGYQGELEQYFENSDHFTWLYENCADYGFILRYPKGKESVTGIVYEPWHYRYVGEEVAHYIMDNNITLEEYWEIIKNG